MTNLASLLGRKPTLVADRPRPQAETERPQPQAEAEKPQPQAALSDKNVLELDQELFFPIATQLGEENELVRNLLIDAEHKITELDGIKSSLGRLVEPVSKTLRAFEEAKAEKLSLQSTLNSTRIAYSKLREDLTTAEKRVATLDTECIRLREVMTVAQQTVVALEATRMEQATELTTRRAQITELQRLVQRQATDLQLTRDENQRSNERMTAAEKRTSELEIDTAAAVQKFKLAEQERSAVQIQLDKALNDSAQMSRRLLDLDKTLVATQARLKKVETALAEAQSERIRLTTALDEANETLRRETIAQNARYEALQARTRVGEKLLEESRQTLAARSDEINAFDRRLSEATISRGAIESKFSQIEAALAERDAQIKELEESNAALTERNAELSRGVGTRESAYERAQEKIQAQDELIQMLESQIKATRETSELQIAELKAHLQREQLDRSMAEGALEAGRKDIARLLREISSLQYRPGAAQEAPQQQAAPPAPLRVPNAA
jgi:chromosome segregation ATPase